MTIDRDIRFSADEIACLAVAARRRKAGLRRSIAAAEANIAAGVAIQRGTHDRNVRELAVLDTAADKLEAGRRAIAHRLAAAVGA